MLGYGLAKAAVHQFTQGLGQDGSGMPAKAAALAILPYVWSRSGGSRVRNRMNVCLFQAYLLR